MNRAFVLLFLAACTDNTDKDDPPDAGGVLLAQGLPAGLLSVRAPAADDVWVVGAAPSASEGPALLHLEGAAWTTLDTSAWPGAELWWVHPMGGELVVVGNQGLILEGPTEGPLTAATGPDEDVTFFGVWGADASDVWAVGGVLAEEDSPALWRRQGGIWSEVDPGLSTGDTLFKVHGDGPDDVWVVGSQGTTMRYDGSTWTLVDSGHPTAPLLTVDVSDAGPVAVGGSGNGLILEYDGAAWADVTPDFQPGYNGVCSEAGVQWAVGQRGIRAERSGGVWTADDERNIAALIVDDWHGCDVDPDGGLWMVGGRIGSRPLIDGAIGYAGGGDPPLLGSL